MTTAATGKLWSRGITTTGGAKTPLPPLQFSTLTTNPTLAHSTTLLTEVIVMLALTTGFESGGMPTCSIVTMR